ncbi:hypothetical protein DIPPA_28594 [Diplonema papillatum]|nr:hypothetical protein DIPPA_28594 [Diplonema papillatum]
MEDDSVTQLKASLKLEQKARGVTEALYDKLAKQLEESRREHRAKTAASDEEKRALCKEVARMRVEVERANRANDAKEAQIRELEAALTGSERAAAAAANRFEQAHLAAAKHASRAEAKEDTNKQLQLAVRQLEAELSFLRCTHTGALAALAEDIDAYTHAVHTLQTDLYEHSPGDHPPPQVWRITGGDPSTTPAQVAGPPSIEAEPEGASAYTPTRRRLSPEMCGEGDADSPPPPSVQALGCTQAAAVASSPEKLARLEPGDACVENDADPEVCDSPPPPPPSVQALLSTAGDSAGSQAAAVALSPGRMSPEKLASPEPGDGDACSQKGADPEAGDSPPPPPSVQALGTAGESAETQAAAAALSPDTPARKLSRAKLAIPEPGDARIENDADSEPGASPPPPLTQALSTAGESAETQAAAVALSPDTLSTEKLASPEPGGACIEKDADSESGGSPPPPPPTQTQALGTAGESAKAQDAVGALSPGDLSAAANGPPAAPAEEGAGSEPSDSQLVLPAPAIEVRGDEETDEVALDHTADTLRPCSSPGVDAGGGAKPAIGKLPASAQEKHHASPCTASRPTAPESTGARTPVGNPSSARAAPRALPRTVFEPAPRGARSSRESHLPQLLRDMVAVTSTGIERVEARLQKAAAAAGCRDRTRLPETRVGCPPPVGCASWTAGRCPACAGWVRLAEAISSSTAHLQSAAGECAAVVASLSQRFDAVSRQLASVARHVLALGRQDAQIVRFVDSVLARSKRVAAASHQECDERIRELVAENDRLSSLVKQAAAQMETFNEAVAKAELRF